MFCLEIAYTVTSEFICEFIWSAISMSIWEDLGLGLYDIMPNIAHELRSPLSTMFNYASFILTDHPNLVSSVRKDTELIRSSAERTLGVADKIMELIRVSVLEPQFTLLSINSPIQEARARVQN